MNPWAEYTPTAADPWDVRKAGHLLRRATFGPTHAELERAVKDGPKAAIDKLLKGGEPDADFEKTSDFMAAPRSLPPSSAGTRLSAWWLWRILHTAHPLREKLSLFWHNHFATSHAKVQNAQFMVGQYRLLHRHALGDFRDLLREMSFDPAMLVWLDAKESKKGKPNENYARELMELFSLGLGHYTEADVREAARAFTGYDVKAGRSAFDPKQHDDGEKTVLGKTGRWKGEDVVKICLDQPACPRFVVRKLYAFLVSETATPADELLQPLADGYRASGFDTGRLVETILRSNHFFSRAAYRQRVKGPVDFAVGIVRGLEGTAGPLPLAEELDKLGQAVFAPPSVKGWDGGPTWLNAQTLLFRQNLALALTSTTDSRFGRRCDPVTVLQRHGRTTDAGVVDFLLGVFVQHDVPQAAREKLLAYLGESGSAKTPAYWTSDDAAHHRLRTAAHLTLTLPEFQLG
jgi:hypothetical protein